MPHLPALDLGCNVCYADIRSYIGKDQAVNTSKLKHYKLAAGRLRDDAGEIFTYRITDGLGAMVVETYNALYEQVIGEMNDPHLLSLQIKDAATLSDRQMIVLVKLMAGQLNAYLESKLDDI